MSQKFAQSMAPGGLHHQLNQLVGDWEGVTQTWFEPNQLTDEAPARGTIRPVYGGRFVIHEYQSSLHGDPFEGMMIIGHNLVTGRHEIAWIDSFHMGTGIMLSQGGAADGGCSVLGKYDVTGGSPPWGWRTEIKLVDADRLIITMYNITPEGEESKGVETVYTRQG